MSDENQVEEQKPGAVTVQSMVGAITDAANGADWYLDRQSRNLDVFYAWWDGQSDDGRKHQEDMEADPFPWEGASDTRIRLAEDICADEARILQAALRGAQANLQPVEPSDEALAAVGTKVLRWLLRTSMAREVRREAKLARNWRQRHGAAITRVTWHEEIRLERKELAVQEVVQQLVMALAQELVASAAQDPRGGPRGSASALPATSGEVAELQAEVTNLIFDPSREQELQARLDALQPGVRPKHWRAAVAKWRKGEVAVVPVPYVHAQRPKWTAFRVFEHVFFPVEVADLQSSPWIAVREWLNRGDVETRAEAEEWADGFAEEVLKQKGRGLSDVAGAQVGIDSVRWAAGSSAERLTPDAQDLYEVWTFYRKAPDADGVPGVYVSVFNPNVPDILGVDDQLLEYAHGEYPFHEHQREMYERPILESRGVPELVMTWQAEIKAQRDARTDRADMDTLPPMEAPTGSSRQRLDFGPGAINYTRTPGSFRFLSIAGTPQSSIEVEQRTLEEVNWFFGRIAENVPAARRQLVMQELVEDYFEEMTGVLAHTYQLAQQFLPPDVVARICGDEKAGQLWASLTAADIRGRFDVKLRFDARDLDPELLQLKMQVMNEAVLPADVAGVIDRAKFTKWQAYAVDAVLAEEIVQPIEKVTQAEVEDEQVQLAKIAGGLEPPLRASGQNAQLRLQVIQNSIQANPQLQQRYAQDEIYKKLIDARVQHFQFQLQQEQNKQIGRVGVAPVLNGG